MSSVRSGRGAESDFAGAQAETDAGLAACGRVAGLGRGTEGAAAAEAEPRVV